MWRANSLDKTLTLGKVKGRRRRGQQRMRWLDGITDSMDIVWASSRKWWRTGKPGVLQFMGSQVGHDWATEQQLLLLVCYVLFLVVIVQSLSCVWLFVIPWIAAHQASLSSTISWSLLKLMSIESVMPSNHLSLCHPLLLLPSIFPSNRVFSNELALCIRWPKYWKATVLPMNIQGWFPLELTGLTSFQSFGHLMWRASSLEKTLMLGKIEGKRRRVWQKMKWLEIASPTHWTWIWSNSKR